jgi:hypothetical protein
MWLSIVLSRPALNAKPQDSIGRRVDRHGESLTTRPHHPGRVCRAHFRAHAQSPTEGGDPCGAIC